MIYILIKTMDLWANKPILVRIKPKQTEQIVYIFGIK
jgi:hypothetical protein